MDVGFLCFLPAIWYHQSNGEWGIPPINAPKGNKDMEQNWIDAMIEREAIPKAARQETTAEFCAKWGIPESTYYFNSSKKENQEKIVELCFKQAKKYAPDVLESLGERATKDNMAAGMFIEYVLEKKKRLDMTSDDKPFLLNIQESIAKKHGVSTPIPGTDSE